MHFSRNGRLYLFKSGNAQGTFVSSTSHAAGCAFRESGFFRLSDAQLPRFGADFFPRLPIAPIIISINIHDERIMTTLNTIET